MESDVSDIMPGWCSVKKVVEADGDHIELTLNFASFEEPVVVNIDAGNWSKMLATPNMPVQSTIRFVPKRLG